MRSELIISVAVLVSILQAVHPRLTRNYHYRTLRAPKIAKHEQPPPLDSWRGL